MKLPAEFEERMKRCLGSEYPDFLAAYEQRPYQALRVNTNKLSLEKFLEISPFSLRPVPWEETGFYYSEPDRPGKHPWHEAGLYYIQEPSAMAVGALAGAEPGEKILDLCAAPGGKSTHLAAAMRGEGLLISNEIHPARAKILSSNVERMGITNAVVTNETPERLAERFPCFFDRIVVDAPCSGEGMFRKEEQALLQWSPENVQNCALRQQEILEQAAKMLVPGGTLVYSTCTFAPEEDEGSVALFLHRHPEFSIKRVQAYEGFRPGRPEWVEPQEYASAQIKDTFRLWPHLLEGEGHYAAVLRKEGAAAGEKNERRSKAWERKGGRSKGRPDTAEDRGVRLYQEFVQENLRRAPEGTPVLFGDQLFILPCSLDLSGLKVLRAGLHLGTVKKNRFEPSHALALAIKAEDAVRTCSYPENSGEIRAYLRGESLETEMNSRTRESAGKDTGKQAENGTEQGRKKKDASEKGWALVLAGGYPLGWGKLAGGVLKNHYPKGLRVSG